MISLWPVRSRLGLGTLDLAGYAASLLWPLMLFPSVVFLGRSTQASRQTPGFSGSPYPADTPLGAVSDFYRLDVGASTWQFEPWATLVARSFRQFEIPWWNPYEGTGKPFVANLQSAVFDPLLLPVHVNASQGMWDLCILGAYMLGGIAMYGLLRSIRLRPIAALLGSVVFSSMGYFALYNNNAFSRGYLYLPALALAFELLVRRVTGPRIALIGVLAAGSFLVGMPEVTFFVVIAVVVYAIPVMVLNIRDWRSRLRVLAATAGSGVVALLLVAPLVTAFLLFHNQTFSTHKPGDDVGRWVDPGEWASYLVVPFINGPPKAPFVIPGGTRNWIAASAIALAFIALVYIGRRLVDARGLSFLAVVVVVIWKCYGLPGADWAGQLPVMALLNAPAFFLPCLGFGAAGLAAIGADVAMRRRLGRNRMAIAVAMLIGLFAWVIHQSEASLQSPFKAEARIALAYAVAGAVAVLIVLWSRWAGRGGRQAPAVALLAIVMVQGWLLFPKHDLQPRVDAFASRPLSSFLLASLPIDSEGRTVGRIVSVDGKVFPDSQVAFGIPSLQTLDALYLDRYLHFVQAFISPGVYDRFVGGPYASAEGAVEVVSNPFLALAGASLVVSDPANLSGEDRLASGGWTRVADFGPDMFSPTGSTVWRNQAPTPRTFLAARVHEVSSPVEAEIAMRDLGWDLVPREGSGATVVVEKAKSGHPTPDCLSASEGSLRIVTYELNRVVAKVDSPCETVLVLTDAFDEQWKASIDGVEAPVLAADLTFRGIVVPSGRSEVEFHYDPLGNSLVKFAPLLGLVLALVLAFWPIMPRRRQLGAR